MRHGPETPHWCLPIGAASSPLPCAAPHCVPRTIELVMFGTASWNREGHHACIYIEKILDSLAETYSSVNK